VFSGAGQRRSVLGGDGLQRTEVQTQQGEDGRRDLGGLDRTALGVVADPLTGTSRWSCPAYCGSPPRRSAIFLVLPV